MEVFDEDKAVKFILDTLKATPGTTGTHYTDDDILDVIDIIWDYYEDHGMLDIDIEGDDTPADKEQLVAHVTKMVRKDRGSRIDQADIPCIVDAELAYEARCDLD